MPLVFGLDNVKRLDDGIWQTSLSASELSAFGPAMREELGPSVLMIKEAEYNESSRTLRFESGSAILLNRSNNRKVVILQADTEKKSDSTGLNESASSNLTRGDQAFLSLAKTELSDRMFLVTKKLLASVRERSPGEMKRGIKRNFSNTPDNFWYVIIQNRLDELQITVRGSLDHFKEVGNLKLLDDRGNTRFKVRAENDIPSALALIFRAKRKK